VYTPTVDMHRLYEFSRIGMCASAEGEYILFEVKFMAYKNGYSSLQ